MRWGIFSGFLETTPEKTIDENEGVGKHQRRTTKRTLKRVIWAGRKAISRSLLCNHYFIKFSFVSNFFLCVRSDIEMEFIEDYWLEFWFSLKDRGMEGVGNWWGNSFVGSV